MNEWRFWIIIRDDDCLMFEGHEGHFADCFFSNAYPGVILDWCEENGWQCDIRNYDLFIKE